MSARRRRHTCRRLTWEEALERYELHLRARRSAEETVTGYLREVRKLARQLERRADAPAPGQVTTEQLRAYVCDLLTGDQPRGVRPVSPRTAARIVTQLACFFGFLLDEGLVTADPTQRLERPKAPRAAPGEVLTVDEICLLFAALPTTSAAELRDRAAVEVLYATGVRRAELCDLDLADLDHAERELTVRHGKGDKGRVVPLTRSAYAAVRSYLERGRPELVSTHPDSGRALFLTARGRRLHGVKLHYLLRDAAKRAGLTKRVSPHTLRRSCATHLLRGNVSLRHIQALLGHESLDTTAVYLRLDRSELREQLHLRHPREQIDP